LRSARATGCLFSGGKKGGVDGVKEGAGSGKGGMREKGPQAQNKAEREIEGKKTTKKMGRNGKSIQLGRSYERESVLGNGGGGG